MPTTTDSDLKHRSQELGLLGKVFGSRDHAPINIAGGLIIMGAAGMIYVGVTAPSGTATPDILKALGALVLAALTFLGGYLGGRERR